MKRKIITLTVIVFVLFILFNIFYNSIEINKVILFSIDIFINNVFPSLFPMFILGNVLISIGIPEFLGETFSKITIKLFNTNGYASFIFFMSMISGFPSNAKYLKDILDKDLINETDCNKILIFTCFSNPLFIINTVGIMFLNSKFNGILIFISILVGNIITGLLFRNIFSFKETVKKIDIKKQLRVINNNINNRNIFNDFLLSIKDSINSLINIFGIITCFLIIIEILNNYFNLNSFNNMIFSGLIELTTGLKSLSLLNINYDLKIYISIFLLCFGSFSVHTQIINILKNYKIKYLLFLFSRIIHSLVSILIFYLIKLLLIQ